MSRYRKVDPRIWNDAKFMSLSDQGKLAFFFLLTHPHMTSIGAMRASVPGLAAEIGWVEKDFREAFNEAYSKGMVKHDETSSLIWLPKFLKYNPPESPNVVKAWINALDLLPECNLLSLVLQGSRDFAVGMNKGFAEALPEAFAKAMPIQEQEQEQEHINPPSLRDGSPLGSGRQKAITFTKWLSETKSKGEKAVSDYEPVWEYARTVGIPEDWIQIAWLKFKDRYTKEEKPMRKRYIDWRGVFLRAVKENWLGLWFFSEKTKEFCLTTVGVCADIDTREAA